MKFIATDIDLSNLLQLESVVNTLQPDVKLENLNSYLYYSRPRQTLYLLVKGSIAYARLEVKAQVNTDTSIGLMISSNNLTRFVDCYTPEMRSKIILTIEVKGESSTYGFTGNNDKINFPHLVLSTSEMKELNSLIDVIEEPINSNLFYLDTVSESGKEVIESFSKCLSFIDEDVRNNAIAIYPNKTMASDSRHVYIYNLQNTLNVTEPIILHKKIAKVFIDLVSKQAQPIMTIEGSKVKIISNTLSFGTILNNGIANISPPSEEDLKFLHPHKLISEVPVTELNNLLSFFMNFYSNKVNYKTITIEVVEQGLNFVIKDSGIVGYNSSHVERLYTLPVEESGIVCTLLIESLRSFVQCLNKNNKIYMYMDNEHPAVVMISENQEIYLAKPKG